MSLVPGPWSLAKDQGQGTKDIRQKRSRPESRATPAWATRPATRSVRWNRMIRRLFTLTSALSLLLCAAVIVLWVRSYLKPETLFWEHCDIVLAHPTADYADLKLPDGPGADRTIELTLHRGGVLLRRERMLGTTREIVLDADGSPARVSATGWHLVGSIGTDRTIILFGPGWSFVGQLELDAGYEDPPTFELLTGPTAAFVGRGTPPVEWLTDVRLNFWMLVAGTLVCPCWWFVSRGVVLKRRRSRSRDAAPVIANPAGQPLSRRLIFASVLSLVLCLAAVRLWIRSYGQQSQLEFLYQWTRGDRLRDVTSLVGFSRGHFRVLVGWGDSPASGTGARDPNVLRWVNFSPPDQSVAYQWRRTGFGWHSERDSNNSPDPKTRDHGGSWIVLAPLWFVVLALSALPAYSLVRVIRSKGHGARLAQNLCVTCGYDLRATPDRCPECGAAAQPTAHPKAVPSMRQS